MNLRAHTRVLSGYQHIGEYDPRDGNPQTNSTGVDVATTNAAAEQAAGKGFVMFFLSGVIGLLALFVVVYGAILVGYKIGILHSEDEDEGDAANEKASYLSRLTAEERRTIIDKLLVSHPHSYYATKKDETKEDAVSTNKDDVETAELDSESTNNNVREVKTAAAQNIDAQQLDTTTHMQQFESESHVACSICINEYGADDPVIIGKGCIHMFHKVCVLEWLERHDVCPCCRVEMITEEDMLQRAPEVLSKERMEELQGGDDKDKDATDEYMEEQRIVTPAW